MDIVLWRINFKSIPCMREHFCRQSCYPCLVAKHDQSSGEGGCTVCSFVLFQRSWRSKHPKLSIFILRPLLHSFTSLATLRQDLKEIPTLEALSSSAPDELQLLVRLLLMNFASDDVITSGGLWTSGALHFRRFKLPFCWSFCSLLFFQNLLRIQNFVYGPVHLNKY